MDQQTNRTLWVRHCLAHALSRFCINIFWDSASHSMRDLYCHTWSWYVRCCFNVTWPFEYTLFELMCSVSGSVIRRRTRLSATLRSRSQQSQHPSAVDVVVATVRWHTRRGRIIVWVISSLNIHTCGNWPISGYEGNYVEPHLRIALLHMARYKFYLLTYLLTQWLIYSLLVIVINNLLLRALHIRTYAHYKSSRKW